MQEQIFVHGYFGRNKGILTGFVIFSIMSGTSYMLWSFLFCNRPVDLQEERQTPPSSNLCLSAGLCLLYFVVSQQLMFYFSEKVVKTDQYTIETGCIPCADEKRCGKVYGEKQRGISVCVKQ